VFRGPRLDWVTCALVGGVAQLAERYVRNVEAVGSNPITSTKKVQVNGLTVGPPKRPKTRKWGHVTLRDFKSISRGANNGLMSGDIRG
jgi:hypothetical protein